ncbi:MAG: Cys-tRNA(Pro) deacylase [Burkholderiales bacterium]
MTPAIGFLEKNGIWHRVHAYEVDAIESTYGEAVAAALEVEPDRLFKTLIARLKDGELIVALVPVSRSLDLRLLARAANAKSADMAPAKDAERATGYVTGGISPFGQRRTMRAFADTSITAPETVFVSAGRRGLQVEVRPVDLLRLLRITAVNLSSTDPS